MTASVLIGIDWILLLKSDRITIIKLLYHVHHSDNFIFTLFVLSSPNVVESDLTSNTDHVMYTYSIYY